MKLKQRGNNLSKDHEGRETRSDLPNKAGVVREPRYVALVAAIEEDRGRRGPEAGGWPDKVPLLKVRQLGEAEVVQSLTEVTSLVLGSVMGDIVSESRGSELAQESRKLRNGERFRHRDE